ncbi:NAD(P)-binding domain-containing protein [Bacillus infantis]|uniref:NAD(P)-binding domain-containing protein n=1 Tax=Bacillus infantis TaxID=324767 RepID=UPI0030158BCE
MKIGIIGLGDIAKKAYLPVLSEQEKIELVLCTRNAETLNLLADKYRIRETAGTVEELIAAGAEAAIVSTAPRHILKLPKNCFCMTSMYT